MVEASCHCGAVRLEVATPPEWVTECGCSICRRLGGLWSYYSPRDVKVIPPSGATTIYMCNDRVLEMHSCNVCACTTHWVAIDPNYDRMGVNARMMDPAVVAAATYEKITGPEDPNRPSQQKTAG